MTTLVDESICQMVSSYLSAAIDLKKETRFTAELENARELLYEMATCFTDGCLMDERRLAQAAHALGSQVIRSEAIAATAFGDGVLRMCAYIMSVISNPWTRERIAARIARAYLEVNAAHSLIQANAMGIIISLFSQILENSAGITPKGQPVPELASQINPVLESCPAASVSEIAQRLKEFIRSAEYATGGISNPWTRKVREQAESFGGELTNLVLLEESLQSITRSRTVLENMLACFRDGRPTDLARLADQARELDSSLVSDCQFRDTYLGQALLGISSYLLRNLEQKQQTAWLEAGRKDYEMKGAGADEYER